MVARASLEVGRPILFASSIIIIVFLPLFTLEGVEGKTLRPLADRVSIAMLGALIYSIFQTPGLSALLLILGRCFIRALDRNLPPACWKAISWST